jgi:type II secretory pathway component PulM
MSEALKRLWTERTPSERATLWIASALLAFGLAYAYLWLPVMRERDRLLVRVPELRADVHGMERDLRELEKLRGALRRTHDLRTTIEQAAAAAGIQAASGWVSPQGADRVRVTIPAARPEQAFRWAARTQSAGGVLLESMRVTWLGERDRVRVETVFADAQ